MTNPTPRMPDEIWAIENGHWFRVHTPNLEGVKPETAYVRKDLPAPETVESLLEAALEENDMDLYRTMGNGYCCELGSIIGEGATPAEAIKSALGKLTGGEA